MKQPLWGGKSQRSCVYAVPVLHGRKQAEGELVCGYASLFWVLELKHTNNVTEKAPRGPSRFYKYWRKSYKRHIKRAALVQQ